MNISLVSALRTLLFVLVGLVIAAPFANAQDSGDKGEVINVAVLNLEGDDVAPKVLETLTSVLRNEAQQYADYDIVNQSPINLSEIVVVLGCDTNNPSCLEQAAAQLEARALIYGRVEKIDQAHKVTIEVFDATSGAIEHRLVRTLADDRDPVVAFREQIQSLFSPDKAQKSTRMLISSSVEGAEVRVNGITIGKAPVERKGLPPGTYEVEVSADGYAAWSTSVDLAASDDVRLSAPLEPLEDETLDEPTEAAAEASPEEPIEEDVGLADAGPPPNNGGGGTNWGAWSAVAVGGLALGGSAAFGGLMAVTEDDLAEHDARRNQMSRDNYLSERDQIVDRGESYELAHRVLLGVGAASVVAGTAWLVFEGSGPEEPLADTRHWDVSITPRGVSALLVW